MCLVCVSVVCVRACVYIFVNVSLLPEHDIDIISHVCVEV